MGDEVDVGPSAAIRLVRTTRRSRRCRLPFRPALSRQVFSRLLIERPELAGGGRFYINIDLHRFSDENLFTGPFPPRDSARVLIFHRSEPCCARWPRPRVNTPRDTACCGLKPRRNKEIIFIRRKVFTQSRWKLKQIYLFTTGSKVLRGPLLSDTRRQALP
ncbi:hypothetical protein EVAR_21048_1 [Eumeta japonica]|uniref:Uncharacterized protein n=1 Tax=Eumeta variegata TaxID=151549 RepID=A0A4C1UZX0_EUMVA|nr:hypothetical protein EVAR_21048_1 [Eumeta japonica]